MALIAHTLTDLGRQGEPEMAWEKSPCFDIHFPDMIAPYERLAARAHRLSDRGNH